MNDRIREILSWYNSENPGIRTNLARMLNHGRLAGTGKMVILPVDQGFEHGPARSFAPNPDAYDPRYHFQLAIESGCNAYAAPLGFLEAGARDFAGQIPLILKVNDHDVLNDERDPFQALTGSVQDALRLGCVGIGFTIYPASSHRLEMYGGRHRDVTGRNPGHTPGRWFWFHHRAKLVSTEKDRRAQTTEGHNGDLFGEKFVTRATIYTERHKSALPGQGTRPTGAC